MSLVMSTWTAAAQPQPTPPTPPPPGGTAATTTARGESTVLIPPQGGTADIPAHMNTNVMLTFPSAIAPKVIGSSRDWEVKEFTDGLLVRANSEKAAPATLAVATRDGQVKVNITLRVVPATEQGMTLVRFVGASAEDAFRATVEAEVERRVAPVRAELAASKKALDIKVRDRADRMVAAKLLRRLEQLSLKGHARNDDNVIVHLTRAVFLGQDAYLLFEIQNRSGGAYRLARVAVRGPRGTDHTGPASLSTSSIDAADEALIGVVPAGSTGAAVVVLRQVDAVLGQSLTLTIEQPDGRGRIVVDRGIVLR
jgi:hypothetical protein